MSVTRSINKPTGSDYVDAASFIAAAKVAADEWIGECYDDGSGAPGSGDCGGFTVTYTTWANANPVTLRPAGTATPHAAKGRTTAYWDSQGIPYLGGRIDMSNRGSVDLTIEDLAIWHDSNDTIFWFGTQGGLIRRCLIVNASTTGSHCCVEMSWYNSDCAFTLQNCAIHRFNSTTGRGVYSTGYVGLGNTGSLALNFCTITLADTTGWNPYAVRLSTTGGTITALNTSAVMEANGGGGAEWQTTVGATLSVNYCGDSDGTANSYGANNVTDAAAWSKWYADPDDDWHLDEVNGAALQAGTPIVGVVDDIDGDTRDGTTPWIGCDEFAEAGGWVDRTYPRGVMRGVA